MAEKGLFPLVLRAFKIIGVHPDGNKYLRKFAITVSISSLITTSMLALTLISHAQDPETFIGGLETFGICQQLMWKAIAYIYNHRKICELLIEIRTEFWPLNKFNSHLEMKLIKMQKYVSYGLTGFLITITVTVFYMNIRPLLASPRQTAMHVYNFNDLSNNYYYISITFLEALCTIPYSPLIFGFDGLFISFVTIAVCQMIMLKYAFKCLYLKQMESVEEQKEIFNTVRNYVQYHDKMLRFADDIKNIYSLPLLVQFSTSTILICVSIYLVTVQGFTDMATAVRCVFLAGIYLFQISVYCAAGNILTDVCTSVGDGIYKSKWWSQNIPHLRMATQMIIMRSQIEKKLLAGGMFTLKLDTLTKILRASYSFFMLLHSSTDNE